MKLFKDFTFEAAHMLPLVPNNHKCFQLHGHSFKARVYIQGPVTEMGWVMDFADLKKICQPFIDQLDHSYLNDISGLENPTSENIALWLWSRLKPQLQLICSIEIMETCNAGCRYNGKN